MIECKHKYAMAILNRGVMSEFCQVHGKMVNETICLSCESREGEMYHPPAEIDFPRRSDTELRIIHDICYGCPLLEDHMCPEMTQEMNPPDVAAQHPSTHCPRDLW